MKLIRFLIIFILFYSCGFKSVVFKNIPYIVTQYADDSLDLTWSQEKEFQEKVRNIIVKNKTELKSILVIYKNLKLTKQSLKRASLEVFPHLELISREINSLIALYLSQLEPEQIEFLYRKLMDQNETIRNRWKKDKTDEIAKRYKFFFGKITEKQRQFIKDNIGVYQKLNKNRLDRRLYVQNEMKKIFKETQKKIKEKKFRELLNSQLDKTKMLNNLNQSIDLLCEFLKTLNSKQQKHYRDKRSQIIDWLESYISYLNPSS